MSRHVKAALTNNGWQFTLLEDRGATMGRRVGDGCWHRYSAIKDAIVSDLREAGVMLTGVTLSQIVRDLAEEGRREDFELNEVTHERL